jgi:hypothetical protein
MLLKEFQYYRDHQEELIKIYNGKIIVIIGEVVVGEYTNKQKPQSAIREGAKENK